MEEASKAGQDRIASASRSAPPSSDVRQPVEPKLMEQLLLSKDERTASMNHSPDAAITGPSKDLTGHLESSYTGGTLATVYPQEQTYYYGGYENSMGNWDEYSYVNANGLQIVPQPIYNDNRSLLFQSGYTLDAQVAYGQFSPMASPLSPIMVDSQLFSPHQIPVSLPYYPRSVSPGMPHVTSSPPVSQTELISAGNGGQEGPGENVLWGPGSGYFLHFGNPGAVGLSGEPLSNQSNSTDKATYMSSLTSPAAVFHQQFGILGPYDHNIGQISQEQRPFHGFGLVGNSSARCYPHGNSSQSSNYDTASISHWGGSKHGQLTPNKVAMRGRNSETIYLSPDMHGMSNDRNRGPRASRLKGKSTAEEGSSPSGFSKCGTSISGIDPDLYNLHDFVTDYKNAKFFIIKSFSEDNVHKSIKYSVWSSTPLGNRKLDTAYNEAKEMDLCPVFLFFSVNASGQFCGVAEMVGPVDFDNDADYWQQDRWSGQFHVQWYIIKDVPNDQFRHIFLENNDKKPVTHSRDSQEVKLDQGVEMLTIFKSYDAETSILDDFSFYDERERDSQVRKARQKINSTKNTPDTLADGSISRLSNKFAKAFKLGEGNVPKTE